MSDINLIQESNEHSRSQASAIFTRQMKLSIVITQDNGYEIWVGRLNSVQSISPCFGQSYPPMSTVGTNNDLKWRCLWEDDCRTWITWFAQLSYCCQLITLGNYSGLLFHSRSISLYPNKPAESLTKTDGSVTDFIRRLGMLLFLRHHFSAMRRRTWAKINPSHL